jgi:hypothetical protein
MNIEVTRFEAMKLHTSFTLATGLGGCPQLLMSRVPLFFANLSSPGVLAWRLVFV